MLMEQQTVTNPNVCVPWQNIKSATDARSGSPTMINHLTSLNILPCTNRGTRLITTKIRVKNLTHYGCLSHFTIHRLGNKSIFLHDWRISLTSTLPWHYYSKIYFKSNQVVKLLSSSCFVPGYYSTNLPRPNTINFAIIMFKLVLTQNTLFDSHLPHIKRP